MLGVAPQQRGVDEGGGGEHGDLGQRLPGLQPHPQQVRPDLRRRRGDGGNSVNSAMLLSTFVESPRGTSFRAVDKGSGNCIESDDRPRQRCYIQC